MSEPRVNQENPSHHSFDRDLGKSRIFCATVGTLLAVLFFHELQVREPIALLLNVLVCFASDVGVQCMTLP